ncbi:MAG TPA: transketolase C-terminal domain-containing protein [Spirochaetia bacterium]|nr:transketolase C-terminal domain-containing protein [Spirochaetia bacterium]
MTAAKNLREAYGQALVELGRKDRNVVALEADLRNSTRSVLFYNEFPDRYFEMGIAEQNMTSTAAGLALAGKIPFVHSFAVFCAGRAYDQLRNSICVPRLKVRICGSSAGLSDYGDGKTHQAIEDMSIMRALPNMTVLCPADGIEMTKMMEASVDWDGPIYFRVNRNELPFVTPEDEPYHIGKMTTVHEGTDVAIFACGVMVSRGIEAAKALAAEGVSVRVINASTVKPFDVDTAIELSRGVKAIVVAEEHTIIGGLGSAVVEALRSVTHAPVQFVGIEDSFGLSAENYEILLDHFGLTAAAIIGAARELLDGRTPAGNGREKVVSR